MKHKDERQKEEKELGCKFIRINPKIHRHIKKSSKKSLIDNISKRLLELEFK